MKMEKTTATGAGKKDKPGEQIRTNIKYFRVNAESILLS